MSNLFQVFKFKVKRRGIDQDAESNSDGRRKTSRNSESLSRKTLFVNETDRKLALREKFGSVYGAKRYEIPVKGEIKIEVGTEPYTSYKLLLYAIEEVKEQGQDKSIKSVDTNITINKDQLASCKKIVVSAQGSEYKLELVNR